MKIIFEVNTDNPPKPLVLAKLIEWLQWMGNNAPADVSYVGSALPATHAAAIMPPPPVDAYLAGVTDKLDAAAPPPPAANTPAPPPPADGNVTPTSDVDSAGIRWDERIHSGAKSKKADGSWTRRKNITDLHYGAVMAELAAAASGTPVNVAATTGTPPPPPAPADAPAPPPPAAPTPPAPPLAAGGVLPLVDMLLDAVMAGKLTTQQIERACIMKGVKNLEELQGNEAKLTEVIDGFKSAGIL